MSKWRKDYKRKWIRAWDNICEIRYNLQQTRVTLSMDKNQRVYSGTGADTDYPNLGIILNGLKKQDWFVSNLSVWLLCTNEDSDDPGDFEEEDLVEYFGIKAA